MKILKESSSQRIKLKKLKSILYSVHGGGMQFAIVYDYNKRTDLANGCSVEYAIKQFGDYTVKRISAENDNLIITVE